MLELTLETENGNIVINMVRLDTFTFVTMGAEKVPNEKKILTC
jgi:hypothetical protein